MVCTIISKVAARPSLSNVARRILENNFSGERKVIRNELDQDFGRILDVGCSTGLFSTMFEEEGYVGIDISIDYINYGKRNYIRRFVQMDSSNLGFQNEIFSTVLVIGSLHHLDDQTMLRMLQEIKRVLSKNGKFLLVEDTPTTSDFNLLGKLVQIFGIGNFIRPPEKYIPILKKEFILLKYYPMRSGAMDHSVFLLKKQMLEY